MKAYADTSFLASLYLGGDANHTAAERILDSATTAMRLPLTPFGKAELLNAFLRLEHKGKMHTTETKMCLTYLDQDIASGLLEESPLRTDEWMTHTQDMIKAITPRTGTRTLDAMHLALAKMHQADTLLSFDKNQRLAAKAAGFSLLPASI
jgi:predicted nucleic acid-binding protein